MNFSELSDFEINKAVARCQSLIVNDAQDAALKSKPSSVLVNCITAEWEFNPCNNPKDAWPIIEDMLSAGATLAINSDGVLSSNFGSKFNGFSFDVEGKPLRAAMIGYLMMQEEAA